MTGLRFDPQVCMTCETRDCIRRCQYVRLDRERAGEEIGKILRGEDSILLTECVTCFACEEYCPRRNHPFYRIAELQESKGLYTAPRPIIHQQIRMCTPRAAPVVLGRLGNPVFSLCIFPDALERLRGPLFAGASHLLGLGAFCNLVYLHFARPSVTRERMPHIVRNIGAILEGAGLNRLICFHDECYAAFTSWAPAYGIETPFQAGHLFHYLVEELRSHRHAVTPLGVKAAYQRPCSNRLIPETEPVLDELFALIGVERVRRAHDREGALCCGSVFRMMGRDGLADEVQERNVEDMAGAGARYCVFNCPMCYYTLAEGVTKKGMIPVMVTDLCLMALGDTGPTPKTPGLSG
ncbi:MAG: heterodisulfide reductase-related iron-sulfur binding cluster [Thermodesulfobacteriota bacterium]